MASGKKFPNDVIRNLFNRDISVTSKSGNTKKRSFMVDGIGNIQQFESNINPREGNLLEHVVGTQKGKRTLEVGCAGGTSAMYILQALYDGHKDSTAGEAVAEPKNGKTVEWGTFKDVTSKSYKGKPIPVITPNPDMVTKATNLSEKGVMHISIDPFQTKPHVGVPENEKGWDGLGVFNVYQTGLYPMMRLVEEKSHVALPKLLEQYGEGSFDVIFIDGMHLYDYTLVDAFYAALLLKKGGMMVIDDVRHPSVKEVAWYLNDNYGHFKRLTSDDIAHYTNTMGVWKKEAEDTRNWSFHCSVCKKPGRIEEALAENKKRKTQEGGKRRAHRTQRKNQRKHARRHRRRRTIRRRHRRR